MSYADVYVTKRCVLTCPDTYYADSSTGTGLCVSTCAGTYRFRDNSTKNCVSICSLISVTFGDSIADMCVYQCPIGYYAQQDANRRCVQTCADGSWANKVTRICILNPLVECPSGTWADNYIH